MRYYTKRYVLTNKSELNMCNKLPHRSQFILISEILVHNNMHVYRII
jgi:hypothetical protein